MNNEVLLCGRIMSRQKNIMCNNRKAIRVKLAIPSDDNTKYDVAYIYIYDNGNIYKSLNISQAIAINGHIEISCGQRAIADVLSVIKEARSC